MLDPRQQALAQEHPEARPLLEDLLEKQERLQEAVRRRDGISWRLDQIPARAMAKQGEERDRLVGRAAVLEEELRGAIVGAERKRQEVEMLEDRLRLKRIEITVVGNAAAQALAVEYATKLTDLSAHSCIDSDELAEALVEARRLERIETLEGASEPSEDRALAQARITELMTLFEEQQRARQELMQQYEPKLRRILAPAPAKKRR